MGDDTDNSSIVINLAMAAPSPTTAIAEDNGHENERRQCSVVRRGIVEFISRKRGVQYLIAMFILFAITILADYVANGAAAAGLSDAMKASVTDLIRRAMVDGTTTTQAPGTYTFDNGSKVCIANHRRVFTCRSGG